MNIPQRAEQATEIRLDTLHRQRSEEIAKVIVPVVRHDDDYLVAVSKGGDELGYISAAATVFEDGDFVPDSFGVGSDVYAFDGDECFFVEGVGVVIAT